MTDALPHCEVSPRSAPVRVRSRAGETPLSGRRTKDRLRSLATGTIARLAGGLHRVCGPRSDQSFGILMYHRVSEPVTGLPAPTWNVTPAQLRAQLAGLLARGFQPWPLARILAARESQTPLPANVFAVTFDDGYANNLLAALPVLRELNVPATIFLATAYLNAREPFPFDDWSASGSQQVPVDSWRPLTDDECRQLQDSKLIDGQLIELGAHTHTHQRFAGRTTEFRQDLALCLDTLRARFGIERPTFALPFGESSPAMIDVVRQLGLRCCLTTVARPVQAGDDPFAWGRFDVGPQESAAALAGKLSGWYRSLATAGKTISRPLRLRRETRQLTSNTRPSKAANASG